MLLPPDKLESPEQREQLASALDGAASRVLRYGDDGDEGGEARTSTLPTLRFDALLGELDGLAPNFGFELPPYFLNNARAIATLEGMALSADPSFDVLKVVYPFALRRLLADPRGSPLLRQTLRSLTRDARGAPDLGRLRALLLDSAALSGRSRTAIMLDAALTRGGRAFAWDFARAWLRARVPWLRGAWGRRDVPAETV